jgi:hypothetical protein
MGLSKVIHSSGQARNYLGHRTHACSRIGHVGLLLLDIPEIIVISGISRSETAMALFSSLTSQLCVDSDA